MGSLNQMTRQEQEFLKAIPSGMEHPRPRASLEIEFGMTKRQVEETIESLKRYGCPIVASKRPPYGYYIPKTEEERQEGLKAYKSQIKTCQQLVKIVESVNLNDFNAYIEELRYV